MRDASQYVAENQFDGQRGPAFEFYTLAALWIAAQRYSAAWRVVQVPANQIPLSDSVTVNSKTNVGARR
jgi:hypothetical protein